MGATSRAPLIVAVLGVLVLTGCGDSLRQHEFAAMSTVVRASVYGRSPDWPAFERAAHTYAARYDHRDPASPVARLNRDGAADLDPLTAATLSRAVQLAQATGGAFDPTMLPVTRLWDFDRGGTLPDEAGLNEALARVDYRRLQVTGAAATLRDAELDLGAIGKGAVVDHLADWLADRGYRRFLLEAGGDVLVSDLKPDGTQWRIWIRHPRSADAPLAIATIGAAGRRVALATSGDYERFVERDGVRYHHILNPATGHPDSDAVSVSVIAGSATEADALATALFVLGSAGEKLLRGGYPGVEGVITYRTGGELAALTSEQFPALHGRINLN
jgi:thiamine biosynthesis lipoprotein